MQKGNILIYLLVAGFILAGVAGGYYLGTKKTTSSPMPQSSTNPTYQSTPSTATPTSTATVTPDETANWKIYTSKNYGFKYPVDWKLSQTEYLNTVSVDNPSGALQIKISEGQYPYGFGPGYDPVSNPLQVTIGGKTYSATEQVINNTAAFVNLKIDTYPEYYILFGTGYPASDDSHSSLKEYNDNKGTILKILSTLKFN